MMVKIADNYEEFFRRGLIKKMARMPSFSLRGDSSLVLDCDQFSNPSGAIPDGWKG